MGCWTELKSSSWRYPTTVLSLYGFLANCRVAEPFLTPYLIGPQKNISGDVVTNYLFPIWTYSYLAFLLPVLLLTDFLRYKPLIVLQGLFLVTNYTLLCFAPGLPAMVFLQVNYAVVTSTEISMFFKGKTPAAVGAQQPEEPVMDSDGAGTGKEKMEQNGNSSWCSRKNVATAVCLLWKSFRESYSSRHLIYWSLWWALATSGYVQVFNYIQLMWDHIEPSATSSIYNGGVEAVCSLVGAVAAFSVGYIKVTWAVWGELALGLFSAVGAGAVYLMALSSNIWTCYAAYAIFKSCYMFLITITTFQIASNLSMECYALTFGINTFVALSLQTVITAVVVDETALGLDIVTQFIVYGSYYALISVIFLTRGIYTAFVNYHSPPGQKENKGPGQVIFSERF